MHKGLDLVLSLACAVLMASLVICVSWQVISRYNLTQPSTLTDELARFILIWLVLIAAALCSGLRKHLAIDLIAEAMTEKAKKWLDFYAVTAGNLSIAALFAAGYVPGILLGGALIATGFLISYRRGYGSGERATLKQAAKAFLDAIPSLLLVLVIIGGIIGGIFTATEASAIAVLYAFILSVFIYRSIPLKRLPAVLIEASITTGVVLLLVSVSIAMSWVMTRADIPQTVTSALLSISDKVPRHAHILQIAET